MFFRTRNYAVCNLASHGNHQPVIAEVDDRRLPLPNVVEQALELHLDDFLLDVDVDGVALHVVHHRVRRAHGLAHAPVLHRSHRRGGQHGREDEVVRGGHDDQSDLERVRDLQQRVRRPPAAQHHDGLSAVAAVASERVRGLPGPPQIIRHAAGVADGVLDGVEGALDDRVQLGRRGGFRRWLGGLGGRRLSLRLPLLLLLLLFLFRCPQTGQATCMTTLGGGWARRECPKPPGGSSPPSECRP
mmetsp:Transcript_16133/g.30478  ORF Transcript_16133/g.30478 Transcript_16133/m.30478 type:complete len:244 (+) Transcript_16133:1208-1939(+)